MTLLPLRIYCLCHAHVWALDPMPVPGAGGLYWRFESHDRPDGTPCPLTIRRHECRPMTPDEFEAPPTKFQERIAADARAAAVRLGPVADDSEPRP